MILVIKVWLATGIKERGNAESGELFFTSRLLLNADFLQGSGFAAADKSRNTNEVGLRAIKQNTVFGSYSLLPGFC